DRHRNPRGRQPVLTAPARGRQTAFQVAAMLAAVHTPSPPLAQGTVFTYLGFISPNAGKYIYYRPKCGSRPLYRASDASLKTCDSPSVSIGSFFGHRSPP